MGTIKQQPRKISGTINRNLLIVVMKQVSHKIVILKNLKLYYITYQVKFKPKKAD